MLKITKKFENELENLRQKPLRARIQYAFDTLWYDSAIPDAGTPALRKACDLIFPKEDDDDTVLQAKGLLIIALGHDIFWRPDYDKKENLEIEACVLPDINRETIKCLIEKQSEEN